MYSIDCPLVRPCSRAILVSNVFTKSDALYVVHLLTYCNSQIAISQSAVSGFESSSRWRHQCTVRAPTVATTSDQVAVGSSGARSVLTNIVSTRSIAKRSMNQSKDYQQAQQPPQRRCPQNYQAARQASLAASLPPSVFLSVRLPVSVRSSVRLCVDRISIVNQLPGNDTHDITLWRHATRTDQTCIMTPGTWSTELIDSNMLTESPA